MPMTRRKLFGYAGASLGVLLPPLGWSRPARWLRTSIVRDDAAAPRLRAGQTLLIDASTTRFSGDGLYLYPAWGQPRPYLVTARQGGLLQFRNPGSERVLWQQTPGVDAAFAGRVLVAGAEPVGAANAGFSDLARLAPALQLPDLPV